MKQRTFNKNLCVTKLANRDKLIGKRLVDVDSTREKAIIKYIKENNIKIYGDEHQAIGIPLFNDGKYCMYTMRAWGGLMAHIWGGDYLDWYLTDFRD